MLKELGEAVEQLEIPLDGHTLVRVLAIRDRLDARIAQAVGAFDAAGCGTSMPPPP